MKDYNLKSQQLQDNYSLTAQMNQLEVNLDCLLNGSIERVTTAQLLEAKSFGIYLI